MTPHEKWGVCGGVGVGGGRGEPIRESIAFFCLFGLLLFVVSLLCLFAWFLVWVVFVVLFPMFVCVGVVMY